MSDQARKSSIDQKQAEQLARLFSVAFNSASLYGGSHPTTRKNTAPLSAALLKAFEQSPVLSFIVDRDSLYIEEWCADKIINVKRIINQFIKASIQSVTFEQGVRPEAVEEFIKLSGDSKTVVKADQIETMLGSAGFSGIRLNYIRYGQITSDQKIIGSDVHVVDNSYGALFPATTDSAVMPDAPLTRITSTALRELDRILSMKQLLENPEQISTQLSAALRDPSKSAQATESLSQLRGEIRSLGDETNLPSIEALLHAVYELKMDLQDALQVQKETGQLIAAACPVQQELDLVTGEVIVKLVREEYRSGEISVKRLGHIIRRMLPDPRELQRLLPMLKSALIADGMSLPDYLQLIKELKTEFEGEKLADCVRDAAEQLGATVDELVSAIRSEPAETARIIMLASEIRRGTGSDEEQLSGLLTEYIEKVSTKIALTSQELAGPDKGKLLRKVVARIETQLIDTLKNSGLSDKMLGSVRRELAERFDTTYGSAASQWMVNVVSTDRETPVSDIARLLESLVEKESQLSHLKDPLTQALTASGYAPEEVESFFKEAATRVSAGTADMVAAGGILSSNNTLYFLNREIKQHLRYESPFSTLLITIEHLLFPDGSGRAPSKTDLTQIMPRVHLLVKGMLRDLDLIGSPGATDVSTVFVILPMTAEAGATVVRDRLYAKLSALPISLDNSPATLKATVSLAVPDKAVTKDIRSFMELVKKRHREEAARRSAVS